MPLDIRATSNVEKGALKDSEFLNNPFRIVYLFPLVSQEPIDLRLREIWALCQAVGKEVGIKKILAIGLELGVERLPALLVEMLNNRWILIRYSCV